LRQTVLFLSLSLSQRRTEAAIIMPDIACLTVKKQTRMIIRRQDRGDEEGTEKKKNTPIVVLNITGSH
jgi:hypothetical protein